MREANNKKETSWQCTGLRLTGKKMLFLFIKGASLFRCVQPELHSGKQTQAQGVQDRIDFLTEIQLIYNVVLVSGV